MEAGRGVFESPCVAMTARAAPTMTSRANAISPIAHGDHRRSSGCAMTCVPAAGITCVAAPPSVAAVAPVNRPTSAEPSGGRSAGSLASDSSATAARSCGASGRKRAHGRRKLVQLAAHQVDRVRRLEREPPRQHPVQDHAERVDVARGRGALAGGLLRGHVRGRSDQRAGLGQRVHSRHPGDAEVGDLRAALLVEEDVGRLQVAVNEPVPVRVREPGGDLRRDLSASPRPAAGRPGRDAPRACLPASARRP